MGKGGYKPWNRAGNYSSSFGVAVAFTLATAQAEEEKTFEGEMSCANCNLGITDKCEDTSKVDEVLCLLEGNGDSKTSEHVYTDSANAKVTGKIEERDGKKLNVASRIVVE